MKRVVDTLHLLIAMSLAFGLTVFAGTRGLSAFDQSIMFDGGYRMMIGQVIYRDFWTPTGPLTFWIQALFFHWMGINYWAYVLPAALQSALGAGAAWYLVRSLYPDRRALAWLASLLTGACLYAPFGTTAFDHTAHTMVLLAMAALVAALAPVNRTDWSMRVLACLAGVCAVGAVLSKQNSGLLGLPVYAALLFTARVADRRCARHAAVAMCVGAVVAISGFVVWLVTQSDVSEFYQCVIARPSGEGWGRLFGNGLHILIAHVLTGQGSHPIRILLVGWAVYAGLMAISISANRKDGALRESAALIAAILIVCTVMYHNAYSVVSNNDRASERPFIGLVAALSIGLLHGDSSPRRGRISALWVGGAMLVGVMLGLCVNKWHLAAATVLALSIAGASGRWPLAGFITALLPSIGQVRRNSWVVCGLLLIYGLMIVVYRHGHVGFNRVDVGQWWWVQPARFDRPFPHPRLAGLRWGDPTYVRDRLVLESDVLALIRHLEAADVPFFVFGDLTVLYGVVGRPSPQPILWFHPGLTYPRYYDGAVDQRVADSLKTNGVRIIVLETTSAGYTEDRIDDFPLVEHFIKTQFKLRRSIGVFDIYHRLDQNDHSVAASSRSSSVSGPCSSASISDRTRAMSLPSITR